VNFPLIYRNIQVAPAYEVLISHFRRESRTCVSYQDFLDGQFLLTRKLQNHGFRTVKYATIVFCKMKFDSTLLPISFVKGYYFTFCYGFYLRVQHGFQFRRRSFRLTVTQRASPVEHYLPTLTEHRVHPGFSWVKI